MHSFPTSAATWTCDIDFMEWAENPNANNQQNSSAVIGNALHSHAFTIQALMRRIDS